MGEWNFSENYFRSFDDLNIFYRCWTPKGLKEVDKAVILLHRGNEHSGRVEHIALEMNLNGYSFFAWDARGNGKTKEEDIKQRSQTITVNIQTRDLDIFVKHISNRYQIPISNIIVLAQSYSTFIAANWVHDYAPKIKLLILTSIAFEVKIKISFPIRTMDLWRKLIGYLKVRSFIQKNKLSHDLNWMNSYHNDPMIEKRIPSQTLINIYEIAEKLIKDSEAIIVPTIFFIVKKGNVEYTKYQKLFFENLASPVKEKHFLKGFYHDIFSEKDRKRVYKLIKKFIDRVENEDEKINLLTQDKHGKTYEEYKQLLKINYFDFESFSNFILKIYFKSIGKHISLGIKTGYKEGFYSSKMLDYITENKANGEGIGKWFIGKWVDRQFLNSLSCRSLLMRDEILVEFIKRYSISLQRRNLPSKIINISAGSAKRLSQAISTYIDGIENITLISSNCNNLRTESKGNYWQIITKDKFKEEPTLIIVSGLYELIPNNKEVLDSLKYLYQFLNIGGYFIYTNQIWNPQIKTIAQMHLYKDKNNKEPWRMRRRIQAEMDQLVGSVGFIKVDEMADLSGIFTVSVSQKI